MKTVGIIAEYNPFHNGHLYHIKKVKELFPDSLIVLVLNGYFLQRGELSILTKEEKIKAALKHEINLVVELPFVFGSQSADIFAYNSIKVLNELEINDIVFGSECNNPDLLTKIALSQLNEKYDKTVKKYLDEGINYPTAMAKALGANNKVDTPNDLLGISYIKAILKINPDIKYHTIQRTNDYHDAKSNDQIISATNIREKLKRNMDIKKYIPNYPFQFKKINTNYFELLKYKIISESNLGNYLTVDEGIENRLKKYIYDSTNLEELIEHIKTKRYTYNKINRMFIHILIGLTKEDNKAFTLDYIRILGFDNFGKKYLNTIKKEINIPFLSKSTKSKLLSYELRASQVYDLITGLNTYNFEKRNKPIKILY